MTLSEPGVEPQTRARGEEKKGKERKGLLTTAVIFMNEKEAEASV